jgi:hypothetical protein
MLEESCGIPESPDSRTDTDEDRRQMVDQGMCMREGRDYFAWPGMIGYGTESQWRFQNVFVLWGRMRRDGINVVQSAVELCHYLQQKMRNQSGLPLSNDEPGYYDNWCQSVILRFCPFRKLCRSVTVH